MRLGPVHFGAAYEPVRYSIRGCFRHRLYYPLDNGAGIAATRCRCACRWSDRDRAGAARRRGRAVPGGGETEIPETLRPGVRGDFENTLFIRTNDPVTPVSAVRLTGTGGQDVG